MQTKKRSNSTVIFPLVASKPFQEFQIDLFFMDEPDQKYGIGMLFVDIFTKYTEVIPIKSKADGDVLAGLMEGFSKMGWLS